MPGPLAAWFFAWVLLAAPPGIAGERSKDNLGLGAHPSTLDLEPDEDDLFPQDLPPLQERLHMEEISHESLKEIMDVTPHSIFWRHAAHGIAKALSKQMDKDIEMERANLSKAIEREHPHMQAAKMVAFNRSVADRRCLTPEKREQLRGEHPIVREAVLTQMRQAASKSWQEGMQCAVQRFGGPGAVVIIDGVDNVKDVEEQATGEKALRPDPKTNKNPFWQAVVTEVGKFWAAASRIALFFLDFLKWELYTGVFGALPIPHLGFKCQPLSTCLMKILEMFVDFFRLIKAMILAVVNLIAALAMSIVNFIKASWKFLTGGASAEEAAADVVEIPIKKDTEVKMEHKKLFDMSLLKDARCNLCGLRLKGALSYNPFEMAESIATGGFGIFKLFLGTIPVPFLTGIGACTACVSNGMAEIRRMLKSEKAAASEHYFKAGNCNPHTLGMCMMLEKVRSCRVKVKQNEVSFKSDQAPFTRQKKFCNLFGGVELRLTQTKHGVRCSEVAREELELQTLKNVKYDEEQITKLSLKTGCLTVATTLKRFNTLCERQEKVGGLFATSTDKYLDVIPPTDAEMVAEKCRKLYGCKTPTEAAREAAEKSETAVSWDRLQTKLSGLMTQVEDFQSTTRAYAPDRAMLEATRLLDEASQDFSRFQGEIAQMESVIAIPNTPKWATSKDLRNLFDGELWDDRCFAGLSKTIDDRYWNDCKNGCGTDERLNFIYGTYGKRMALKGIFRFFHVFAKALNVWDWSPGTQCKIQDHKRVTKKLMQGEPRKEVRLGPKLQMLVLTEMKQWEADWETGILHLRLPDCPGKEPCVSLVRDTGEGKDWLLARCNINYCNGARPGMRLVSMTMRGARGPTVTAFKKQMTEFFATAKRVDQVLVSKEIASGEDHGLSPAHHRDFREARKTLLQIRSQLPMGDPGPKGVKAREHKFEELLVTGAWKPLLDVVRKSNDLKRLWKERGWSFKQVALSDGDKAIRLDTREGAVQSLWQLDQVLKGAVPHKSATMQVRRGFEEMAHMMLHGAAPKSVDVEAVRWENFLINFQDDPAYSTELEEGQEEGITQLVMRFKPLEVSNKKLAYVRGLLGENYNGSHSWLHDDAIQPDDVTSDEEEEEREKMEEEEEE